MSKFAKLNKNFETEDGNICCIFYYGGDKAKNPLINGCNIKFEHISKTANFDSALIELSEKGYIPKCEFDGDLYFIK